MISNILYPENAILAALETALPLWVVQPMPDQASIAQYTQASPAVFVWSQPIAGIAEFGHGAITKIQQEYTVLIAVRNVSDIKTGKAAREQSGEAAVVVITTLTGYKPSGEWHPLTLSQAQYPPVYNNGLYLLPITFETFVTITNIRKNT